LPRAGGVAFVCVTTLPRIDFSLFKALNDFAAAHDGLVEDPLRVVAMNAQYVFAGLLAILFLATGKWRSRNGRVAVVAAGFSALLALGMAHLLADKIGRAQRLNSSH